MLQRFVRSIEVSVLGFVLAGVAFGSAASAQATPRCRPLTSPVGKFTPAADPASDESSYRGAVDLDGDGNAESVAVTASSGSDGGTTSVTIQRAGEQPLVVSAFVNFSQLEQLTPVPPVLQANPRLRSGVESILFAEQDLCAASDPSHTRLMTQTKGVRLVWLDGLPTMPTTYTRYVDDPALVASLLTRNGVPEGADPADTKPKAVWITYLGHNHGRTPKVDAFRQIARSPAYALLATEHGVVAVDRNAHRYAWLWVFPGGRKLRFPSIEEARLAGRQAIIGTAAGSDYDDGEAHNVTVDLDSGTVTVAAK